MPWQLFGYGRSDRSTKLTRGLISETPAGFRSRRGLSYDDSAPVTPHNAPFPTYKTPRVPHAARRRGGLAARGARSSRKSPKKRKYFDTLIDGLELAVATLSLQLIGHFVNPGLYASFVLFTAGRARSASCADDLVAHLDRQRPLVGYDVGKMDQAERRIRL